MARKHISQEAPSQDKTFARKVLTKVEASCHESARSEEHTSELQSHSDLVCRLLLEKKKKKKKHIVIVDKQ